MSKTNLKSGIYGNRTPLSRSIAFPPEVRFIMSRDFGNGGKFGGIRFEGRISVKSTSLGFRTVQAVNIKSRYTTEMHDLMRMPASGLINHISDIEIPDYGGIYCYRFRASGYRLGSLTYATQYTDEIRGISGGGDRESGIIAKFVLSGEMRLENGKTSLIVKAGQACIFDTRRPWRFWKSANTSYRWVMLPKIPILQNTGGLRLADQPVLLDASKPEAKIAMSFLQQLKSQDLGRLSLSGIASTEEAASSLLAGAVSSANVLSSREFDSATLAVAQDFIDNNLECPELSPALIANAISVSVRTLHRAFSNAGSSAMGYVRMRRLQGARNDLLSSDPTEKISSIAAKWRFSDASHFIRQFKEVYGVTPSSYVREFRSNGGG